MAGLGFREVSDLYEQETLLPTETGQIINTVTMVTVSPPHPSLEAKESSNKCQWGGYTEPEGIRGILRDGHTRDLGTSVLPQS